MSSRDGGVEAATDEESRPVSVQRLSMPIEWVVTIVGVVAAGALSLSLIYARSEAHAADNTRHLAPEVVKEGGIVTAQKFRRILRRLEIKCAPSPAGGLACTTSIPEEAD